MITGRQCYAARALLGMTQANLSGATGLSAMAISAFEKGGATRAKNRQTIRAALEAAGVIFLADGEKISGGEGVRLAAASVLG